MADDTTQDAEFDETPAHDTDEESGPATEVEAADGGDEESPADEPAAEAADDETELDESEVGETEGAVDAPAGPPPVLPAKKTVRSAII